MKTTPELFALHTRLVGAVATWQAHPSPGAAAQIVALSHGYLGPHAYAELTRPLQHVDALIIRAREEQEPEIAEMVKTMRGEVEQMCARMIVRELLGKTPEQERCAQSLEDRARKVGALREDGNGNLVLHRGGA